MYLAIVVLIVVWTVTVLLAYEEGMLVGKDTRIGPDNQSAEQPSEEWLRAWYTAAHSDIQWTKLRSWETVRWTLILQAALSAVARQPPFAHLAMWPFVVVQCVLLLIAWFYLYDLHRFAAKARSIADHILDTRVPGYAAILRPPRSTDRNHVRILCVKLLAVTLGCVLAAFAMVTAHTSAG